MSGETVNPEVPAHGPLPADPAPATPKTATVNFVRENPDPVFNRLLELNPARKLDLCRIDASRDFVALYAREDGAPESPDLYPLYECDGDFITWASNVVGRPGVLVALFQGEDLKPFGFAFDSDVDPSSVEPQAQEAPAPKAAEPAPAGDATTRALLEEMRAMREQNARLMERLAAGPVQAPPADARVAKVLKFAEDFEDQAMTLALASLRGEDPRAEKAVDGTLGHVRKFIGMLKDGKQLSGELAELTGGGKNDDPLAWLNTIEKASETRFGQRIVGKILGPEVPPSATQGEGDALAFA